MIPTEIRAHFNTEFTVPDEAAEVPDGYTPKFILGGASSLTIEGSISGDDIAFSLTAEETENLATGQYWYQVIAESVPESSSSSSAEPVDRRFIAEGTVWVVGKITGSGVHDGRSVAEKIVAAIDATIEGKATADQQSYMIQSGQSSRQLSRMSLEDLMIARKYYATIVAAEKRKAGGSPLFKKHKFEFVKP
jgi:hypothetical protein